MYKLIFLVTFLVAQQSLACDLMTSVVGTWRFKGGHTISEWEGKVTVSDLTNIHLDISSFSTFKGNRYNINTCEAQDKVGYKIKCRSGHFFIQGNKVIATWPGNSDIAVIGTCIGGKLNMTYAHGKDPYWPESGSDGVKVFRTLSLINGELHYQTKFEVSNGWVYTMNAILER